MSDLIRLISVEQGRNNYHLLFKGYIHRFDINKIYDFDFIGTEISYTNSSLTNLAKEQLTKYLQNDFGYGPYNLSKIRSKFGNSKNYYVDL